MVSRIGDFNFVILNSFKANYFFRFIGKTVFFILKSNNIPWIYFFILQFYAISISVSSAFRGRY